MSWKNEADLQARKRDQERREQFYLRKKKLQETAKRFNPMVKRILEEGFSSPPYRIWSEIDDGDPVDYASWSVRAKEGWVEDVFQMGIKLFEKDGKFIFEVYGKSWRNRIIVTDLSETNLRAAIIKVYSHQA